MEKFLESRSVLCNMDNINIYRSAANNSSFTSGFWPRVRACALRAPVFLDSLARQTGRCAPPTHRSFAAPPKIKKINYFQKQTASLQA
jgi:hypothetical protein